MTRLVFALAVLMLVGCAPVASDPYSQVALGNAAIEATRAEEAARQAEHARQLEAIAAQATGTASAYAFEMSATRGAFELQQTAQAATPTAWAISATQTAQQRDAIMAASVAGAKMDAAIRQEFAAQTQVAVQATIEAKAQSRQALIRGSFDTALMCAPWLALILAGCAGALGLLQWYEKTRPFQVVGGFVISERQMSVVALQSGGGQRPQLTATTRTNYEPPRALTASGSVLSSPVKSYHPAAQEPIEPVTQEVKQDPGEAWAAHVMAFLQDAADASNQDGAGWEASAIPRYDKMQRDGGQAWDSRGWMRVTNSLAAAGVVQKTPGVGTVVSGNYKSLADIADAIDEGKLRLSPAPSGDG